ncbi:Uncharacterised protein [Klebsiella pneumoniae]|uniref:Uncharacterized protein n=1 Tax=Klebsiella pneumoniae TaxID=573 RepID=A0A378H493_KLEPN|nr:Uncharacterised protein [Klebsiella pneumoniae]
MLCTTTVSPVAGEAYQRFQLRTLDILAGCLVAKSAINLDAFQLPFRVLVEGADPDIPNALSSHGIPLQNVREDSMTFNEICQ